MGERVVNGDFADGLTGWTPSSGCPYRTWEVGIYDEPPPLCYVTSYNADCTTCVSQSVDFTNVDALTLDVRIYVDFGGGNNGWGRIYIDDEIVWESSDNIEEWSSLSIDVSSYSGTHLLKFCARGIIDPADIDIRNVSAIGSDLPPAPVAAFAGYPTGGVAPLDVLFTDESTNTPTSWLWSFGDGTLSTVQHPWHTYADPGSYSVNLKATNAGGFGTLQKDDYIVVSTPPASATLLWKMQFGPS